MPGTAAIDLYKVAWMSPSAALPPLARMALATAIMAAHCGAAMLVPP